MFNLNQYIIMSLQFVVDWISHLSANGIAISAILTPILLHILLASFALGQDSNKPIIKLSRWLGVSSLMLIMATICVVIYGDYYFASHYPTSHQRFLTTVIEPLVAQYLSSLLLASLGYGLFLVLKYRYISPFINRLLKKWVKPIQQDSTIPEPNQVKQRLDFAKKKIKHEKLIKISKKKNCVFLGLDQKNKPIYIAKTIWNKSNIQIVGVPGAGKGVSAAIQQYQSLRLGNTVIVLAPKQDQYAYSFYDHMCNEHNIPMHYIDLTADVAQINPLTDITPSELYELLIATLDLTRTGEGRDHYTNHERAALNELVKVIKENNQTLSTIVKGFDNTQLNKDAQGLIIKLTELANIKAINASNNASLSSMLTQGGCIFVQGSTRNESLKLAMKLMHIRLLQLVESRSDKSRHVSFLLDEVKYLISQPLLDSLGTIRDKNAHYILTHQSLADLECASIGIDPSTARNTIIDNCSLRWIYRCQDYATAQWVSQLCGTHNVYQPHVMASVNSLLAETQQFNNSQILVEAPIVHTNEVQNLPEFAAVCIGVEAGGIFAYIKPIQVNIVIPHIVAHNDESTDATEEDWL